MKLHPIALAIPFFLAAIGFEVWRASRRGLPVYRFTDAVANLGCGFGNQAFGLVTGAALLGLYGAVHDRWALLHFAPGSLWPWVIGFVGVDLTYYWWHRFSHEVNVMWAVHAVHHQSEDYNLAVALRQAYFSTLTGFPFYAVLALLGVPPLVYATHAALSLLYQFWIHTELIDRLPRPLEWVLNTPSHHRVHHGINPEYLDKNYGAILIVWDRLFGTFEPERAPVVYGVTQPLASFNPVWANFETFVSLARKARGGWLRAWKVTWARPDWDPDAAQALPAKAEAEANGSVPFERATYRKFAPPEVSSRVKVWIAAQVGLASLGLMALLMAAHTLPSAAVTAGAGLIVLASLAWSGVLEHKRWGWPLELARLGGSAALLAWVLV